MNFTNEIASNRRNGQVSSFKEALEEMLRHSHLRNKFKQASLLASWQQMMGENIADKTLRLFIKERILYAELSSSPLKAELLMAKAKIVTQLNKQVGESLIDEVVFI
jgi:predicted nucleic acid-binding Zn ribbon protein